MTHSTTDLLKMPNTPRPMIMLTKQTVGDRNGRLLMGSMTGELAQEGDGRMEGRTRRDLLLTYKACGRNTDDGVMTAPIAILWCGGHGHQAVLVLSWSWHPY